MNYYLRSNLKRSIEVVEWRGDGVLVRNRTGEYLQPYLVMRSLLATQEQRDEILRKQAHRQSRADSFRRENCLNGR